MNAISTIAPPITGTQPRCASPLPFGRARPWIVPSRFDRQSASAKPPASAMVPITQAGDHPALRIAPVRNRAPCIAKAIGGMAQVHQVQAARLLHRGHPRIHQHIGQSRARATSHHRQRKQPTGSQFAPARQSRRHQRAAIGRATAAKGHACSRRHQHGANRGDRRHEHQ